jgi:hypothetical protein
LRIGSLLIRRKLMPFKMVQKVLLIVLRHFHQIFLKDIFSTHLRKHLPFVWIQIEQLARDVNIGLLDLASEKKIGNLNSQRCHRFQIWQYLVNFHLYSLLVLLESNNVCQKLCILLDFKVFLSKLARLELV